MMKSTCERATIKDLKDPFFRQVCGGEEYELEHLSSLLTDYR